MKILTWLVSLLIAACAAYAGMVGPITHTDVGAVATTLTNQNAAFLNGYIEGIYVDITGSATPTATVNVVTGGGSGAPPSRTILNDAVTADTYYPIRVAPTDTAGDAITANEDARIPLAQDTIEVTISGVSTQDVDTLDAAVYIYLDR